MFGPLIAVLAGVMLNKMQQAEQRKQAEKDMHLQFAQQLSPNMPMFGFQAERLRQAQEANAGAQVAQLLPMALGQFGTAEPKPGPQVWNDPGIGQAFDQSEALQRQQAMAGFNAAPGRLFNSTFDNDWGY